MKELFDGVYARWVATMGDIPLYNTKNTENEDDVVYPYATFSLVSNVEDMSGHFEEDDEIILIQFNVFSEESTCTDINLVYKALKAAFHKHDLVVDGYNTISMIKGPSNLFRIEKIWQYNISFQLKLNKG